ncbi:maleylpyruvate isomerase family mycothiol-dependent enzyme [Arthrobacter sp. NEB 688]|uniref:maleylpyruvate isomerase family mycothiol-dependent enzyme n=1 Tax=Arthrobacter sp. NEB 688 TaxID=904039 RepID=UPI0015663CC0|nr:maleylpyruvate isomerase family mycothiol-dependent enzyme [Arthrobacter sp. NEB 688]QKE84935.1 maleylpyruvate isomerase family mycothiol-dependent enzyme [Arthrobacter sp. NEB 688]
MSTDPAVDAWVRAHERVCSLVLAAGEARMEVRVPATPAWTARDLLSHMVGLGADVLDGNEPDDHGEAWTAAQVEARRGRDVAALVDEWRSLAPELVRWMGSNGTRPLGDVVIHEQDLRGALGEPGGRSGAGLEIVLDRMLGRVAQAGDGLPPLALDDGTRVRVTSGAPEEAGVVLRADPVDLLRVVTARRTADEVRDLVVRGDVTPWLPALAGLGPLPERPLPGG